MAYINLQDSPKDNLPIPPSMLAFLEVALNCTMIAAISSLQRFRNDNHPLLSNDDHGIDMTQLDAAMTSELSHRRWQISILSDCQDRIMVTMKVDQIFKAGRTALITIGPSPHQRPRLLIPVDPKTLDWDWECDICHEDIEDRTIPETLLQIQCDTKHVYGSYCIAQWLADHDSCPTCRQTFERGDYTWPRWVEYPAWFLTLKEGLDE
jgi:hypothetical protein